MNATRALTKRLKSRREKTAWSAGRVQTPTLALLVEREAEVLAHVPRPYWRLDGAASSATARAGPAPGSTRPSPRPATTSAATTASSTRRARGRSPRAVEGRAGARARDAQAVARDGAAALRPHQPPARGQPALRLVGAPHALRGAALLRGAQDPHLPAHRLALPAERLPRRRRRGAALLRRAAAGAAPASSRPTRARLLERGLENDGAHLRRLQDLGPLRDHPDRARCRRPALSGDDKRLFDLVVRRFLGAFHPPALWERVERVTEVAGEHFRTRARALMEPGWREVLPAPGRRQRRRRGGRACCRRSCPAERGERRPGRPRAHVERRTPRRRGRRPRLSEARLLSLMENAGQDLEDEDLAAALHEKGIGTPATRADIIENLIAKGYAVRLGKALRPTVKGIRLIDTLKRVHIDRLASPALTGEIEQHLLEVEKGRRTPADVPRTRWRTTPARSSSVAKSFEYEQIYGGLPPLGPCPNCGRDVYEQAWFYRCEEKPERDPDCPVRFWKDTSGRYLDRGTVAALLRDGKSGHRRRLHRARRAHLPRPPRDRPRRPGRWWCGARASPARARARSPSTRSTPSRSGAARSARSTTSSRRRRSSRARAG